MALRLWPLRDFGDPPHQRVDDRPYGGGPGMVMLVEPLERALAAVHAELAAGGLPRTPLVLFTPTGRRLDQPMVRTMAASPGAVLLCGRYEGVDQRFIDRHVDLELSLGDFVLSGGELPALALIDAVARLQGGVLGDAASHEQDSFPRMCSTARITAGPWCWRAMAPVSRSATRFRPRCSRATTRRSPHGAAPRSLRLTWQRRPDLIAAARAAGALTVGDERTLAAWSAVPDPGIIIEGYLILCGVERHGAIRHSPRATRARLHDRFRPRCTSRPAFSHYDKPAPHDRTEPPWT